MGIANALDGTEDNMISEEIPVLDDDLSNEALGLVFDDEGEDDDIDFDGFDFDEEGNCIDKRDIRSFFRA